MGCVDVADDNTEGREIDVGVDPKESRGCMIFSLSLTCRNMVRRKMWKVYAFALLCRRQKMWLCWVISGVALEEGKKEKETVIGRAERKFDLYPWVRVGWMLFFFHPLVCTELPHIFFLRTVDLVEHSTGF